MPQSFGRVELHLFTNLRNREAGSLHYKKNKEFRKSDENPDCQDTHQDDHIPAKKLFPLQKPPNWSCQHKIEASQYTTHKIQKLENLNARPRNPKFNESKLHDPHLPISSRKQKERDGNRNSPSRASSNAHHKHHKTYRITTYTTRLKLHHCLPTNDHSEGSTKRTNLNTQCNSRA